MSDVGLHTVFESLAWPASVPLPRTEFAIHELLGQPVVIHRDHVTTSRAGLSGSWPRCWSSQLFSGPQGLCLAHASECS